MEKISLTYKISKMGFDDKKDVAYRLRRKMKLDDNEIIRILVCKKYMDFDVYAPAFEDREAYYKCRCEDCNMSDILTLSEIQAHVRTTHKENCFDWETYAEINRIETRNLKQRCSDLGISYLSIVSLKSKTPAYKNYTDDEIIEAYLESRKRNTERQDEYARLKKYAEDNGINYKNALQMASKQKISIKEYIDKAIYKQTHKSFRQRCEEEGLCYDAVCHYRKAHNMTEDEVIALYKQKKEDKITSFRQKCIDAGVNYSYALNKRNTESITEEEAIELARQYLTSKRNVDFKTKCKEAGVAYTTALSHKKRYNLSDEEAIKSAKSVQKENNKGIEQSRVCRENDISYKCVLEYLRSHPDTTFEYALNLYKVKKMFEIKPKEVFKEDGVLYYRCKCKLCGKEDILSVETMLQHHC